MGKMPSSSPSLHGETEEEGTGRRRPWGSAVATGRGKEIRHGELAPHLNLGRGAARRWRHGGRRVASGGAVVAALWSASVAREWGKRERTRRRSVSPT